MALHTIVAVNLLAPNVGLIVWITLVFLTLLYVLRKFAWGPITAALLTRERTIHESIQRAERALAEAREVQADNERARRDAEQEAQRILREARDAAERLRTDEVERTRTQIRQLQQSAQEEIGREKQRVLSELRSEVAEIAVQAASKILRENLDDPRQRRLVDEFVVNLGSN